MRPSATLLEEPVRVVSASAPSLRILQLSPLEIDAAAVRRWRQLAERSCDGNAFLLPEFVIASWKHLTPQHDHVVLVVEQTVTGNWLAAGVFRQRQLTTRIPVPHVVSSNSRHTYRTGLLWDAERGPNALDALLCFMAQSERFAMGLEFRGLRLDSRLARELEAAAGRQRLLWQAIWERQVPAVFPQIVSQEYIEQHWSKNRRKTYRRNRAQLEKQGEVSLRLVDSPEEIGAALETFLELESRSWKGEAGTACLSTPADSAFVREMVAGLAAHGNVVVSELRAGDRVVASALNLVCGTSFYAFKIGWERELTAVGPGVLHESELLMQSPDRLSDYTILDSCAAEDSYLADYWPERIPVGHVVICWSPLSELALHLSNVARTVKRMVRSMWQA